MKRARAMDSAVIDLLAHTTDAATLAFWRAAVEQELAERFDPSLSLVLDRVLAIERGFNILNRRST
jgi:hypothetical protein